MNMSEFFAALLTYAAMIPAAAVCFFPMTKHLKFDRFRLAIRTALFFALTIPAAALISTLFGLTFKIMLLVLLPLYFALYNRNLDVPISKSLAIFAFTCALMSVISNAAVAVDALIQPHPHRMNLCFFPPAYVFCFFQRRRLPCLCPCVITAAK